MSANYSILLLVRLIENFLIAYCAMSLFLAHRGSSLLLLYSVDGYILHFDLLRLLILVPGTRCQYRFVTG